MITYVVFEGKHKNDNDGVRSFRKESRALEYARKSKAAYVLVNRYEGTREDQMAYYEATVYESNELNGRNE